jgi:hypothetical protein
LQDHAPELVAFLEVNYQRKSQTGDYEFLVTSPAQRLHRHPHRIDRADSPVTAEALISYGLNP